MIQQVKKGITYAESKEADMKVRALVENMLENVAANGDKAVREYSEKLDKWSPESFRLSSVQIQQIIAGHCLVVVDLSVLAFGACPVLPPVLGFQNVFVLFPG